MDWLRVAAGAGLSLLAMLLLGAKWKLTPGPALLGGSGAVLAAGLIFGQIYPLCETPGASTLSLLGQVGLTLTLGMGLMMFRFWRDPERTAPETEGVVLSAADGEVIYVREADSGAAPLVTKQGRDYRLQELLGAEVVAGSAYVIGIEMNFLDVHVNRCPLSGRVTMLRHIGGLFLSLRQEEALFVNERFTTVIEGPAISVATVQIASRLVRRIESYLHLGEETTIGQRLGVITLGSLVAVIVPRNDGVKVLVKPGDRVTAGISVLARYSVTGAEAKA